MSSVVVSRSRSKETASGAAAQFAAEVSINFGSSVAGAVIPSIGLPLVVVARQLVAAVVFMPFYERNRSRTRRDFWGAVSLGVLIAVMNLSFYASVHLLGLGVAATIEFLGPLGLALFLSRRLVDLVCAIAAAAGVFLLIGATGELDILGVALALVAAGTWAGYIVIGKRVFGAMGGRNGLAVASVVSLVLVLPIAFASFDLHQLTNWTVIGLLLVVGVLSSVIPYALDTVALKHMHPGVYAVVLSIGPAIAALAGFLVMREHLTIVQIGAIALVCAASAVAIATQGQRIS